MSAMTLHRVTLDRQLADGASILAGRALARRANKLSSRRCRRSLATGLRRVLADAERPPRFLSAAIPVQRKAVLRSRQTIERIAADLEAEAPVAVEGVAQIQLLLTDGNSPFYVKRHEGDLEGALERAELALIAT
jgi:hypothetical protein